MCRLLGIRTGKGRFFRKENNNGFVLKNGYRYHGSFIGGGEELETKWLVSKIDDWIEAVE